MDILSGVNLRAMFAAMELREILLILISFGLGIGCIHRIRVLDRYEKEPFAKMALAAVLGGGCAMVIALGLYTIIERLGFHDFESYIGTMLVIAPVEEMAKLIGLLAVLGIIRNELNEPVDGIIYISCVALGFSLIENIIYAAHPSEEYLLLARLLTATPLHICFSALMGLTFYLWLKNRQAFHLLLSGFFLACLSHGAYDWIVFNHYSVLLLGATFLLMYIFTRDLFIYALAVSPYRISLAQAIAAAQGVDATHGPACMHCGNGATKRFYPWGRHTLWQCQRCDHFTVNLDALFRICYHFSGILKSTAKKHLAKDGKRPGQMTLFKTIHICLHRKLANFRLEDLDEVLERQIFALKKKMKTKWYLPDNLYRLSQPGVTVDYTKMLRDGRVAFWQRLVFPFSSAGQKTHRPPDGGPPWQWAAFILPEAWFPIHGLWGVLIPMAGVYLSAVLGSITADLPLDLVLGVAALLVRTLSGFLGGRIYYRRYGRWP
jgi:RsiW-degrading membrane proteinase PrsW (M82 family)